MKNYIKVVLVFVLAFFIIGATDVRGETLQEAVKSVLQNNPDITSVAYNRLGRDQEVRQAMADFFPTIDSSLSTGFVNQNNPLREHFQPRSATIRLNQNLFRGGATLSETMRQKSRVASEAYLLQGASENTALLTCRVYLNYLRALEQNALSKENLLIHQRFYDQIGLRSKAGVDRGVDFEQVKARMALAESNLVVTEANIENARTDYKAVIGYFPVNPVKPVSFDTAIPATLQVAEQVALENHPTLKSARADIEARKFQHKTARALVYPSLDVSAGYTWGEEQSGPWNLYHDYEDYFRVDAMLKFNIFNGFINQARIKETSYLINEAEEIAKKTERQTIQSVRLSYEAYMADQRRIKQLEQYVISTSKAADAFTSQWSIGRRTLFDVLDTSAEKITAKSDLINAEYDKMYDSYRILSGLGRLVYTLGLQWPEESRVGNNVAMQEVVYATRTEEPVAPKEVVVIAMAEEPVAPQEVVAPKADEPAASQETSVAAVAPSVADDNLTQVSSKPGQTKSIQKEVPALLSKWLNSWKTGDMETYRSYYDEKSFRSKGMNLDAWIAHKTNVFKKSKNINISIDDLQISQDKNIATAVFTQEYSSSILKDKGKKTLKLKKIDDEWKIYGEIM